MEENDTYMDSYNRGFNDGLRMLSASLYRLMREKDILPKDLFTEREKLVKRARITDDIIDDSPSHQREPRNQHYSGVNFATYADCPRCHYTVSNGISGYDKRCPVCGLLLSWR